MTSLPFWAPIRRDVVRVEGPDAEKFLQGQLSQDVETLEVGKSAGTLLLQPKGHVDVFGGVARVDDQRFALVVEAGFGEVAETRLRRFLLRTDAEIVVATDVEGAAVRFDSASVAEPPASTADAVVVPVGAGSLGFDIVGADAPERVPGQLPEATADDLERVRIASMAPSLSAEVAEPVIPGEFGPAFVESVVSFTKGCYVGQELVARVHSRGDNTPRKLRLLQFDPSAIDGAGESGEGRAPEVGAPVTVDGDEVGTVSSIASSDDGGALALALISRTALDATDVEVTTPAGTIPAQLSDAPVTP